MGFLSDIWKGAKNVFKGILKVFEPILKPLGKLFDSSFGKALMIGLSIFTLGSSMVAGAGAFSSGMAAGNGFVASFVEGGQVFLQTLTGMGAKQGAPGGTPEALDAMNAAGEAGGFNVVAGGPPELAGQGGLAKEAGGVLSEAAGSMAMGPGPTGDATMRSVAAGGGPATGQGAMLPAGAGDAAKVAELTRDTGSAIAAGGGGGGDGNWLSKAAKAAVDFASSEGGGQIVGSVISGIGGYYTEKDRQDFEDRIRRQWMQGDADPGIRNIREQGARVGRLETPSAQDIARQSRSTASEEPRRPFFERPYGAGAGA